jgi:3-isopropylmalate dehydrogenase
MMLDFLDEQGKAEKVRKAVAEVVAEGKIRTYDMAKMAGHSEVIEQGARSTVQMADAIIAKL